MNNKVYAILKHSYEFDDHNYGDYWPCFLSLNKNDVQEQFNSLKKKEIDNFYKNINNDYWKEFIKKYPNRKDDFQIVENTNDYLEIYFDNWCYKWKIEEYELNKLI